MYFVYFIMFLLLRILLNYNYNNVLRFNLIKFDKFIK